MYFDRFICVTALLMLPVVYFMLINCLPMYSNHAYAK